MLHFWQYLTHMEEPATIILIPKNELWTPKQSCCTSEILLLKSGWSVQAQSWIDTRVPVTHNWWPGQPRNWPRASGMEIFYRMKHPHSWLIIFSTWMSFMFTAPRSLHLQWVFYNLLSYFLYKHVPCLSEWPSDFKACKVSHLKVHSCFSTSHTIQMSGYLEWRTSRCYVVFVGDQWSLGQMSKPTPGWLSS